MAERMWCKTCEVSARGEARCWCCGERMGLFHEPVRTGRSVGAAETRGTSAAALLGELGPHMPQPSRAEEARAREAAAARQAAAEAVREDQNVALRNTPVRSFFARLTGA